MITLETGLPGAGKTLYCVDKLLRLLVGSEVESVDAATGQKTKIKRVIYSNINGLLFDHEKIGSGAEWTFDAKAGEWTQPKDGDKHGLNNWHEWAKPGSIIVFDEVQKPWPKAAVGSKVPPCITALETHRHMGVDLIVLTQHPMLIHSNLVQLVGRHLHIRRMGNMGLAIVYEWDGCSKTLLFKNSLSKSPLRYSKDAFTLYKSAELHTKTPRKIPSLVFGAIVGLVAMLAFFPVVYARIAERINPSPVVAKVEPAPMVFRTADGALLPASGAPGAPSAVLAASVPALVAPDLLVSGCIKVKDRCKCFTSELVIVPKSLSFCSEAVGAAVASPSAVPVAYPVNLAADLALASDMSALRARVHVRDKAILHAGQPSVFGH